MRIALLLCLALIPAMAANLIAETARARVLSAIADPNVGFLLTVVGTLGVYAEFCLPGWVAPGVAGGIMLLLGLHSLSALPINWTGFAILILAVSLFVLEARFAAHGVFAIVGMAAMVLGAILMRIHWITALSVSLPFALITTLLATAAIRARRNKST